MQTITAPSRHIVATTINDEDQAILIQIRDNLRRNYFLIGDIANKYVYASVKTNYAVGVQDIYDEVGKIVGKSGRTVRYYAEEASFYDHATREEYDILPFSFFVFARTMGDNWKNILDYAMEHPHHSLAAIKRVFLPVPQSIDSQDSDGIIDNSGKSAAPVGQGADDQGEAAQIGPIVNMMIDLSARAISLVSSAPIPDDKKQKLISAAMTIREVVASMV